MTDFRKDHPPKIIPYLEYFATNMESMTPQELEHWKDWVVEVSLVDCAETLTGRAVMIDTYLKGSRLNIASSNLASSENENLNL